jgi:hypothetical protein
VRDTSLRNRLMAILAADVAGYSRLMATDDCATIAALDALTRACAQATKSMTRSPRASSLATASR